MTPRYGNWVICSDFPGPEAREKLERETLAHAARLGHPKAKILWACVWMDDKEEECDTPS